MQLDGLKGVIYTRKSTVSDGKSTRDQERECRQWCATNGIPVDMVFTDEGVSASRFGTKKRDAWAELKSYLRPGQILVAWEASRAARDIGEWAAFRNLCAQLKVPFAYNGKVLDLTSGDDRFVGGLDALLAERESEQICERVNRGIRGAIAAGTPHSRPPWGYRAMPRVSGESPQWEEDPVAAPRIREAAARIIDGESNASVLRWLRSTGPAPANITSLKRCMLNPQIAGKRVHRGEVKRDGTWPAIITDEQHEQLKLAMSGRYGTHMGPEPKHLCSGIATCGKCGEVLHHRNYSNRKPIYICKHGHVSRLAEMLDAKVEEMVFDRLSEINPADYDEENPRVAEALRQIADLESDLAEWESKAVAGEVSASVYSKVEQDRRQKISELRPQTVTYHHNLLDIERWPDASMRQKRNTVRALFQISVPPLGGNRRATRDDVIITPI